MADPLSSTQAFLTRWLPLVEYWSQPGVHPQLRMAWPESLLDTLPVPCLPPGYALRPFQWGDEPRFYQLMQRVGWKNLQEETLRPWLARILPEGWHLILHETSGDIVASAMCLHNYKEINPFQGELGWVACDPAHGGKGLGVAVSAACTARFIRAGYRHIHLFTEDFRLAAIKSYLKLGYAPHLSAPGMTDRWQAVCTQLKWTFTPEQWKLPDA